MNYKEPEADWSQKNEDGSLGLDFINLFQQVIINFDDMFLEVTMN
ncbi:hypothetical protein [Parabacteroides timonensis]|nr:hypothetical protein [Parabacteroides timonensis]